MCRRVGRRVERRRSRAPTSLFASAAEDEHGDPTLSAVETSWPSASLPRACVALVALPPAKRGAPPTLAGLDARGVLRCGEHVVARDVRSFAAHFGDIGDETLPFSSKAAEKKEEAPYADAALASASAYAKRWRAWSADDASPSLTRPEARLVYATNSDELRVVELAEVFGEASRTDPIRSRRPTAAASFPASVSRRRIQVTRSPRPRAGRAGSRSSVTRVETLGVFRR
jgi:hypothetical protein